MRIWGAFLAIFASLVMNFTVFGQEYIVKMKDSGTFSRSAKESIEILSLDHNIAVADKEQAEMLLQQGLAEYIEENAPVEALDYSGDKLPVPEGYNDTYFSSQKYFEQMGIEPLQREMDFGSGIRVAVIDSGLNREHYEFENANVAEGYNVCNDNTDTNDTMNHGTGVFGILCADTNNNAGIAGIAPKAEYIPLVCMCKRTVDGKTETYGTIADVIKCIYKAVDEYDCKVINVSAGSIVYSALLEEAVNYAAEKGALLISAAGNKGTSDYYYPASFDNVICVGSLTNNMLPTSFTEKTDKIDVSAPGYVYVPTQVGGIAYRSGTSFSCPIISGTAALLAKKYPDLDKNKFIEIIKAASSDVSEAGRDYTGYGYFNLAAAVDFMESKDSIFISPVYTYNKGDVSVKVYNKSNAANGNVAAAAYADDTLYDFYIGDIVFDETKIWCGQISLKSDNVDTVKIFALKDLENMQSISDARVLKY